MLGVALGVPPDVLIEIRVRHIRFLRPRGNVGIGIVRLQKRPDDPLKLANRNLDIYIVGVVS